MKKYLNQFRIEGKERLFILLVLFVLLQICIRNIASAERGTGGLSMFYATQNAGIFIWMYAVLILIIPNLFAINCLNQKNNHFSTLITTRITHKSNFINHIVFNAIFTFITILAVQITILLTIHWFYSPILLNPSFLQLSSSTFSENDVTNLLIHISLSCVGYTVFSTFLYSLQSYIRNSYLFRTIGFLFGIVLYVAPVIINNILQAKIPSVRINYFFSGLCASNLLNPGTLTVTAGAESPYIVFLIGCVIYMSMSFFFLRIMYKKERYCD